jgi:hypothetical protein
MEFIFPVVLLVVAVVVAIWFVYAVAKYSRTGKAIAQWLDNNRSPVLSEPARFVAKRAQTSGDVGGRVSTWYFVTFELPSGDRKEFSVRGKEYGMLTEGDEGLLTYQGTRYHRFERGRVRAH